MAGGATPRREEEASGGPRRVAVVGAGPAGFYGAAALLKAGVEVDLLEKLPAPHGLVRYGVAPDHQKIKAAARVFERTAQQRGFRYFGNVVVGRDVSLVELLDRYDQVLVTIGAAADRRMGVAGEDLQGSVSAVGVVGWYNGHPELTQAPPLDTPRAIIVGMGNVALDVARVLIRDPAELTGTDIDEEALDALRRSQVREIVLLGRRGPAQAAFDLSELMDISELAGVELGVSDPAGTLTQVDRAGLDNQAAAKVDFIQKLPRIEPSMAAELGGERRVILRFLASPQELCDDGQGRVGALRLERNELSGPPGQQRARGTGEVEELRTGLVIRSIGYRAVPLEGLPFAEERGVVPNDEGRVLTEQGEVVAGLYVAGWIKRGPTGLIGTNKSCAQDTVRTMLADAAQVGPSHRRGSLEELLAARRVRSVSYEDWLCLDAAELEAGQARGRARVKTRSIDEMLAWLDASAKTRRAAR